MLRGDKTNTQPQVFIIKLRPTGGAFDNNWPMEQKKKRWAEICEFCRKNGIVGVGWQLERYRGTTSNWDFYYAKAKKEHKSKLSSVAKLHKIKKDDIIVTRHMDGTYYIGKVKHPWKYIGKKEYRDYDVVNTIGVTWLKVKGGRLGIPNDVSFKLSRSSTVTTATDIFVSEATKIAYNRSSLNKYFSINCRIKNKLEDNPLESLGPKELEDIVGLYLQIEHGYKILPSTWGQSEKDYEFYAMKGKRKIRVGAVQVKKSGELDIRKYVRDVKEINLNKIFLYSGDDGYKNKRKDQENCDNQKTVS